MEQLLWDKLKTFIICRGVARPLFEWGGGGVSSFCQVINPNFAESLQSLINISFPKIVGERVGGGGGWVVGKFFPDIQNIFGIYQKIFWTYRNLSKNTIIFQDIS